MTFYKCGAKCSPDKYRLISELRVISKIINKILHRQLITFLYDNQLLTKFLFCFKPNVSTEYAATILLDTVWSSVDSSKLTGAVFVNRNKDFGTV